MGRRRRSIIQSIGGIAGLTAFTSCLSPVQARSNTATLKGRILYPDGSPAKEGHITIPGAKGTFTDTDGHFEQEVEKNSSYTLGFWKRTSDKEPAPVRNGAPHLYRLGRFITDSTSTTDIGEITLPEAYLVTVRAVDSNRDPIENANFGFGQEGWSSFVRYKTNEDGLFVIENADFAGIELTGDVTLSMKPPENSRFPNATWDKEMTVTEDVNATFVFNEDGLESFETAASEVDGPTDEDPGTESSSTEGTDADSKQGTSSQDPVEKSQQSRGFLSNDGDESFGFLSDPFFLTVGGFVLSVGGITIQLVRGD